MRGLRSLVLLVERLKTHLHQKQGVCPSSQGRRLNPSSSRELIFPALITLEKLVKEENLDKKEDCSVTCLSLSLTETMDSPPIFLSSSVYTMGVRPGLEAVEVGGRGGRVACRERVKQGKVVRV